MNAVELEKELWNINNELVKAGIFPRKYPTMADAVAELVRRYTAQPSAQRTGVWACPHCGYQLNYETSTACERCEISRR